MILYSYSKASYYPEKMVKEKKLFKKNLGPKILEKMTFFTKNSKSKSPKILNYTKGTKLASYLYAQKKIREKKIIQRPVERARTLFFQKSRKNVL
jgi:hypothetical protein